jgi:hypothetical protein
MGFSEHRWKKGIDAEATVRTVIEELWNVKSTSGQRSCPWDYWSDTDVVEQKTRFGINSTTYEDWLFPLKKIYNCRKDVRKSHLVYFYPDDNTLWYCDYDEVLFADFKTKFIWAERTDNILIPAKFWKRIDWGQSTGVHLHNGKNELK